MGFTSKSSASYGHAGSSIGPAACVEAESPPKSS